MDELRSHFGRASSETDNIHCYVQVTKRGSLAKGNKIMRKRKKKHLSASSQKTDK